MQPENVYKALTRARVLGALETARAAKSISHPGLKGRVAEILISDLFRPLLPPNIGIASGQIVDFTGRLSRQQDIILFDSALLPPLTFDPSASIVPLEAAIYVIEVKTKLGRKELQESHDSAGELLEFRFQQFENQSVANVIPVLLALDSSIGQSDMGEPKRYQSVYKEGIPNLKALCVVGRGYWSEHSRGWLRIGGDLPGDDVLGLIGGVMNTFKRVSKLRGGALGHYLIASASGARYLPGDHYLIGLSCTGCGQFAYRPAVGYSEPSLHIEQPIFGSLCVCGGRHMAPSGTYTLTGGTYLLGR